MRTNFARAAVAAFAVSLMASTAFAAGRGGHGAGVVGADASGGVAKNYIAGASVGGAMTGATANFDYHGPGSPAVLTSNGSPFIDNIAELPGENFGPPSPMFGGM